jgi:general transcription factor 3C polypeptide 5 (transcription factor C subunit 1)
MSAASEQMPSPSDPQDAPTRELDTDAPVYAVPAKRLGVVEHPMIIKNIDKAIKTFGKNYYFRSVGALNSGLLLQPRISVCVKPRHSSNMAKDIRDGKSASISATLPPL